MKLSIKDVQTPLHNRAIITLNGERVEYCTEADEEAGYVERFKLGKDGKPYIEGEEIATERVEGEVRIIDPEDPEA